MSVESPNDDGLPIASGSAVPDENAIDGGESNSNALVPPVHTLGSLTESLLDFAGRGPIGVRAESFLRHIVDGANEIRNGHESLLSMLANNSHLTDLIVESLRVAVARHDEASLRGLGNIVLEEVRSGDARSLERMLLVKTIGRLTGDHMTMLKIATEPSFNARPQNGVQNEGRDPRSYMLIFKMIPRLGQDTELAKRMWADLRNEGLVTNDLEYVYHTAGMRQCLATELGKELYRYIRGGGT